MLRHVTWNNWRKWLNRVKPSRNDVIVPNQLWLVAKQRRNCEAVGGKGHFIWSYNCIFLHQVFVDAFVNPNFTDL